MELLEFANQVVDTEQVQGPVNRITHELTEVGDRLAVVESFSHVWAVRTGEGLVLFDASGEHNGPKVLQALRRWSNDPVHTIVYTHGHMDHVGGAHAFVTEAVEKGHPRPRFVGHENVARRLARYKLTNGYNLAINRRQFAPGRKISGYALGQDEHFVHPGTPDPDVEFTSELSLTVGDDTFVLRHDRGETDDHAWTEWAGHDTLFVGDFLIWNFPNCGNPAKVLRYPAEWAAAMRRMLTHRPELVAPAHGLPVQSLRRAERVLTSVAEALEHLVGSVIELLNVDAPLDEVLHTVKVPDDVISLPWLRPFYDEPEFVVRNIYRTYGGWWDGNPAKLLPAREATVAAEVVALTGGTAPLVARAQALAAEGDLRTACELIELAVKGAPTDRDAHAARAAIYAQRRMAASSLMAKGIFEATAVQSAEAAGIEPPVMQRTGRALS